MQAHQQEWCASSARMRRTHNAQCRERQRSERVKLVAMRLFHFCHTYINQTETFLFRSVEKSKEEAKVSVFAFNQSNIQQFYPNGTGNLEVVNLRPFNGWPGSLAEVLRDPRQLASSLTWG